MLTHEQNEALTRVGPGTPMGKLMRRYWIPALLSWEVPEPDCPPVEIRLLGEDLVAFRNTSGEVGIVSAYCAHRRASLFWGRNEEDGLRCVYHGWKFDTTGACVDMPSEPAESNFKERVTIPAYATCEAGGVVWCYMGPAEKKPVLPLFQWTQVPPERRGITKVWQETNWLQALEGGIDTVHSNFLHGGRPPGKQYNTQDPRGRAQNVSRAARLEVVPTDYGYTYAGIRDMGAEGTNQVRGYHWVMPWNQIRGYVRGDNVSNDGHCWVPIDDYNTMVFNWHVILEGEHATRGGEDAEGGNVDSNPLWFRDGHLRVGTGNDFGIDIDPENDFRSIRNRRNKYGIDRELQRTETYTGITGVNTQDRAVQESMGAIADRSLERLGTTDKAIIATRRYLAQAIKTVEEGGDPPGIHPSIYGLRAYETVLPKDSNWFEEMRSKMFLEETPLQTI